MASVPAPNRVAPKAGGDVEDDLDRMPLVKRKKILLSTSPSSSSPPAPPLDVAVERPRDLQNWSGLPRGVKFDPTDEDLLWHLLAKVGKGKAVPNPFINLFIICLGDNDRIGSTHPQKLPGVEQDGSASYFFHRSWKHQKIKNNDIEGVLWQKVGKSKPVILDGVHEGCKQILVLYMSMLNGEKLERTNWVMHRYHLGGGDAREGEIVVSKIFYQESPQENDKNSQNQPPETVGTVIRGAEPVFGLKKVAAAHNSFNEQISSHALLGQLANHDIHQMKYLNRVKVEPQFIAHSGILANCSRSGALHQKQTYSNGRIVEKSTPSTLAQAQLSDEVLKNELEECQHATHDVSSRLSMDLMQTIGECTPGRSQDENHSADSQLTLEECCTNGAETVLTSTGTSIFHSPDSDTAGSPLIVSQSSPGAISCETNILGEFKYSQQNREGTIFSNQMSVPEVILPILREENEYASVGLQSLSTAFPTTALGQVKTETSEEGYVNCNTEESATMFSSIGALGLPDEVQAVSVCFSEGKICLDDLSSTRSSLEKNLDAKCKYSCEAPGSQAKFSRFGQIPAYQIRDNQHVSSVASTCSIEMESKLLEESHTNNRVAVVQSFSGISLSDCLSESTCTISQCASESNTLCSGIDLHEVKDSICFLQASSPREVYCNAMNRLPEIALSSLPTKMKVEPLESALVSPCKNPLSTFRDLHKIGADIKSEFLCEPSTDGIDNIPLIKRMKMPVSNSDPSLNLGNDLLCSQRASLDTPLLDSINDKTSHFYRRRKKKKTATDSVETALEEDAPGLLQVLLDKGIAVDEIKLYGDIEDDDLIEISPTKDSFEELETVIRKLFSERPSLFKFSSLRNIKGSKAVYCLACLISLIEQTRYLRFRDSPVEWGWCRDLQAFIFVFERHNRIVLERPEYGYATYFFELVESLPVDWQIKRLVTAMKLSSCSRTTLIENRSLLIGQDLTEGEARVLEAYGWKPNTGLGTMLNYCERVVHDKKNERYSSEWRAKIGKLLMVGHDGGRTVLPNIPKKVTEYMAGTSPETTTLQYTAVGYVGHQNSEIKLET